MARVVCVVLVFDPRVRNDRRNPVAHPRNVLFTAGGRGFLSPSGTVGRGAMINSRPRRGSISVGLRATSCAKGRLFRTFGQVHRSPWGPVPVLSILCSS